MLEQLEEGFNISLDMTTKLKILVVENSNWMGHFPLQSHHLMELLAKRGHHIIVLDYDDQWRLTTSNRVNLIKTRIYENYKRIYEGPGVTVIRPGMIPVPILSLLSASIAQSILMWKMIINKVDIVLSYSIGPSTIPLLFLCKKNKKPFVFHSFDVLHHLVKLRLKMPIVRLLEKIVYSNADIIVTISPSLNRYIQTLGVSNEKCYFIPPGVNINLFKPTNNSDQLREKWGLNKDDKVVLFVGRLFEFSGLDMIVKSMPRILKSIPNAKLIIVGDGPLESKLVMLKKILNLDGTVKLLGKQPYFLVPEIMSISDLCINPFKPHIISDFAFPSKIIEYMACGKAVLATNLPGTVSVLNNVPGVILTDYRSFVDHLIRLLKDESLLKLLGKQARLSAEKYFSFDIILPKFEKILADLLSNRK